MISDTIRNILIEALNDEYKARATYRNVIEKFGEIRPFINIIESEERHIKSLLTMFDKYGIEVPEDHWYSCIETPESVLEACQAGVEAEIDNGEMYERMLESVKNIPDIGNVLIQLQ